MTLSLIVALPFIGALFPGLMIRAGRDACALVTGLFTAVALILVGVNAPAVLQGNAVAETHAWLPQIGLDLAFRLDGLGLLFAGLILGIGLLVILYARFYLAKSDPMGRFYAFLLLFQGAMTGIVLSDNLILLVIFWELTSIASFLLIGYWRHLPEARQGARMALAVTGAGGLAMLGGVLILGKIAGTYQISALAAQAAAIQASPHYGLALVLILLGAFTKSAQFPFHFWLPHAMAAPTPVSAYLHSATMVKAGLFLMARLWPVLAGTPEWFWIVASAGLVTMVVAAVIALFQDDLKGLLAYSTVSHLGLVTMLLGMGTVPAAQVAVFHILNHATFKAALFMAAGIVDHEAHTRNLRHLGGLARLMPVTFALSAIAALSMAGFPPLNGFLSKEMMLTEVARTGWLGGDWTMPALVLLGASFSVAYSLRFLAGTFLGPKGEATSGAHDPGPGLWAAPALLAVLVVVLGLAPMAAGGWLVDSAAAAVTGSDGHVKITHWHGLKAPALWMSLAAIGAGLALAGAQAGLARVWNGTARPEAKRIFDRLLGGLQSVCRSLAEGLHHPSFSRQAGLGVAAMLALAVWAFAGGGFAAGTRATLDVPPAAAVGWGALILASALVVLRHHDRLLSLVLTGIVGLIIAFGFAYLSAPDLALTQAAVEVVTVILMLLALNFLPNATPRESTPGRRLRDGAIAIATGAGVAALIHALMTRSAAFPPISAFHLEQSKPGAGGTNAVNTIIVDFRGYDTFGEIIVLGIAALVIFAAVEALLSHGPANDRLLSWRPARAQAGGRHPMMMAVAARVMLPLAMIVGVFIFLRGHNMPGGGFVAGLIVAIAYVMQYMASGFGWTQARQRIDHHALVGAGVLVALATGIGAWFNGMPFLTSAYGYVSLWPLETFELATAALFDLGVFLCVLGAVLLALASISRIAVRSGETVNPAAYDPPTTPEPGEGAR